MTPNTSKEAVLEQLVRARISLLLKQPFWGTLATRLILKDATDTDWCKTAATDGRYLYYNRNFISKLNKQECIFLVAHEVAHCVYDHMDRRGSRKPKMWNAAADFVINYELHEHNVGKLPDPTTSGVQACFDAKYKGMFTEEVYELLLNDPNQNFPEFDIHLESGASASAGGSSIVVGGGGDSVGEPMTEEERRVLGDEIRAAVMQAAIASNIGNCPAGVRRLLKDLTEPQMDWREILNLKLQSMFKNDYTWMKCSRKAQSSGFYLPGTKEDMKIEVAIAIDSSGSISDEMIRDFIGEVKGIMLQFTDFKIRMWCSDTEVYNEQIYTPENLDEIDDYEVMGRGGNDFNCNWEYMKENDIHPERFLHFSDGFDCGRGFGPPEYCPTTYIIHSDPQHKIVAPEGMDTCWYEK